MVSMVMRLKSYLWHLDKMVIVKIKAPENISASIKIYHWYSDKISDKDYQTFSYGETMDATHYIIEDGYIVFQDRYNIIKKFNDIRIAEMYVNQKFFNPIIIKINSKKIK